MTAHDSKGLELIELVTNETTTTIADDEFSIPLDISDIISICKEYNKLGWQIQDQVESILELGMNESIKSGKVKRESLPFIKQFLQQIVKNAYFGDAVSQAQDCIQLIKGYELENKKSKPTSN